MKKSGLAAAFALAAAFVLGGGLGYKVGVADGNARPSLVNDTAARSAGTGAIMADGSVYAGLSPDTQKPMSTTPADVSGIFGWDDARRRCEALDAFGHKDWRMPTKSELNVLFQNRYAIGGFNETGSYPIGWYSSSSPIGTTNAWAQRFDDGLQLNNYRGNNASLRCVR